MNASLETPEDTLSAFYDTLQHTQWMPTAELDAYQRRQLRHILLHAVRTVPFYKDRLAPILRGNDDIDWSRWTEIPILTRSDLQQYRPLLLSHDVPKRHGYIYSVSSSGTTGEPIEADTIGLSALARQAAGWRMYDWHEFDFSADFAICRGMSPWPEGSVDGYWSPPWHEPRGVQRMLADTTPFHRIAEWIGRKQPKYFAASSFTLPSIVEEMSKQRIKNSISCMLGFGGQATPLCRKIIRDTLGIPVVERYSSQECGYIAQECAAGSLHVLSELVLVEIVDGDGKPCPPDVDGRVVVTVLHNSAQPIIRYEVGDIAAFTSPCSCGRTLPVLTPIRGRIKHMFRFPGQPRVALHDGRTFKIIGPYLDPSWYQIAQIGPMTVEIRFVSKRQPSEEDFRKIKESLPSVWRNIKPKIIFRQLDAPPAKPGRKHVVFVNEWDPEAVPGLEA